MERNEKNSRAASSGRERKPRKKGGVIRKLFFWLFTLMLVGVCTAGMLVGIFMTYVDTTLAPTLQVRAEDYTMDLSSILYYEDKETGEWKEYQTVHGVENRILVDFKDIPDAMWQAAVAIEDHRFFEHNGVDWKRTAGATVNMFIGMKNTFGGSTLTQQMLKNMTEDNDGTVNRKVREIFRALEFEKNYTKDQILELYLNMIYLGKGCYGVQTAAQYYFGKDVSDLSVAECACLIAITNNPSLYGPMYDVTYTRDDGTKVTPRELNKARQELIIDRMAGGGDTGLTYLTPEEAEAAKAEVLQFTDGSTAADDIVAKATGGIKMNSWFTDQVILDVRDDLAAKLGISTKEALLLINNSGYNIYTTMDPKIQTIAESVYEDRSNLNVTSRSGQLLQSGITIIDPYTGNIVAMVGKVGEKTENLGWNYATGRRQVGSSIKPLTVYAPAIENGAVSPATTFDDYPVQLLEGTPWPKNSPNRYRGMTNVTTGVQHSINTIAVQTLQAVGTAPAFAFATENLGLGLVSADMDVSPLGMGGLTYGLNTVEMAAAYAAFANNGIYNSPRTYLRVEDAEGNVILENESESRVAMKESTAYLMNKLLKNAVVAGTGTSARFNGMNIAGKTGTTSQNYDRYFVGYTPYYVAAVWTGYDENEKISYDGNPAITMWKKVMQQVHAELPNKDFERPASGLQTVTVCADSGKLCTDACHADLRGSRAISVEIPEEFELLETDVCTLHEFRDYCTAGSCLATASCTVDCVVQAGLLNIPRVDYGTEIVPEEGAAYTIAAEDAAYVIADLERAMGLVPRYNAEGLEVYPEVIGCPVHSGGYWYDPELDWPWNDPSDPNYIPPMPGYEEEEEEPPVQEEPQPPQQPEQLPPVEETPVPQEPVEPEPPAAGDDWWSDFWEEENQG